ncbi:T-cell receptor gamma chain V domain 1 [Aix galericulata]|nr:T-cell receptor gamma chain V domain 1 [Aix galericulata]
MLLLAALVATAAWSDGLAQKIPIQTPISITKSERRTRLQCHLKDISANFDSTTIHWYQQKENNAPEWMFYISPQVKIEERSFQGRMYTVETVSDQKMCTLTIKNIAPDAAATYYCAYWDPHYSRNPAITSTKTPSVAQPQAI